MVDLIPWKERKWSYYPFNTLSQYGGALLIVLLESDVEWLGKISKDKADCCHFFALVD